MSVLFVERRLSEHYFNKSYQSMTPVETSAMFEIKKHLTTCCISLKFQTNLVTTVCLQPKKKKCTIETKLEIINQLKITVMYNK